MYRQPAPVSESYRPGGESDEFGSDSDDYDGYDMPGPGSRNKKISIPVPTVTNGQCKKIPSAGDPSDVLDDDWGTPGEGKSSLNNEQINYVQPSNTTPSEEARIACSRGNVEKVKRLLEEKVVNIDDYFPDDYTLLLTAAAHGRPELVKFLLDQGADVKKSCRTTRKTALMTAIACIRPQSEDDVFQCVKYILEVPLPKEEMLRLINVLDSYALSAIIIAIKRREERRRVAEYLLDNGADPNVQDITGRTCLFLAAEVGDGKSCRLLLEKGADVNIIDDNGFSAYDLACDKGFHVLSELLYLCRSTKWRPGENPALMQKIVDISKKRQQHGLSSEAVEGVTVREDSYIETLLSAINASKYTENFRKHRVTYLQFLAFDDDDLKAVGIEEVGIRKNILESIRDGNNEPWSRNSLQMVPVNKKATAAEVVCMITTSKSHVQYIGTTLKYLRKRIIKEPSSLRYGAENNKIRDAIFFLNELAQNCNILEKQSMDLRKTIEALKDNAELKLGDSLDLEVKPEDLEKFIKHWESSNGSQQSSVLRKLIFRIGSLAVFSTVTVLCLRKFVAK